MRISLILCILHTLHLMHVAGINYESRAKSNIALLHRNFSKKKKKNINYFLENYHFLFCFVFSNLHRKK